MKSITNYPKICKLLILGIVSSLPVKGSRLTAFVSSVPKIRTGFLNGVPATDKRNKWFLPMMVIAEDVLRQNDVAIGQLMDDDLWKEYDETFREVVQTGRVMKKDTKEDMAGAIEYLATNAPIVTTDVSLFDLDTASDHRDAFKAQRQNFLDQTNFTSAQYDFIGRTLTYLGDFCAKRRLVGPLKVAWHKLKETGTVPRENCISTYLYVLSLDETSDLSAEVAAFHDLVYEPNEKTLSLRVKSLVGKGDATGALEMLNSLTEEWKKLRTYLPILSLFCARGEMASALRLYEQMRNSPGVHFDPDTYTIILGALAEQGYFRHDSSSIIEGYPLSPGPKLFDHLVTEMADDLLEINSASVEVLQKAFAKGFPENFEGEGEVDLSDEMPLSNHPADANKFVLGRVLVNETTGICPRTGAKLRLLKLEKDQRVRVHDTLLDMAAIQYEEFRAKLAARYKKKMQQIEDSDFAVRELARFSKWLDDREGKPFTAIVDGPNVAYFGSGNVNYRQVELVVEELEKMNETPLVTMPQKYVAEKFHVGVGFTQILKEEELEIMNRLLDSGKMYTVPAKCLDDYYWMLASVSEQKTSSVGVDIHVPPSNSERRFPGLRPMLITCDQMRDHKLELLEPRLFRRWYSSFIVNYNISCVVNGDVEACNTDDDVDGEEQERQVEFFPADFFSREIQGNAAPDSDATVWHFPVSEWGEHERLCIRLG
eukprot:CAMPEP_0195309974 /NCGR_PEP_ID=MMETSP0707-20130614/39008_1 /TAXON_ID=33640 /ORGANISM="Asterionellopsis glacialis, Strain CCMP134" /LENGTH=710 /DNA_ID=CAMNT_0040374279 /DNA_START=82 /DNA_END=2214 /DNA_ORIENTATION=+